MKRVEEGLASDLEATGLKGRKQRSDSLRNRERLLAAAKAGFAVVGPEVSLEEIARRAEVGIGTLYRHFPTRDAVVEAVYRREVQAMAEAATQLIASRPPVEALRAWMLLFINYIATKRLIAPVLNARAGGVTELYANSGVLIIDAMARLLSAAQAAGEIRTDVDENDVLRALVGFTYQNGDPAWEASCKRLIDVLIDGLGARKTRA